MKRVYEISGLLFIVQKKKKPGETQKNFFYPFFFIYSFIFYFNSCLHSIQHCNRHSFNPHYDYFQRGTQA